MTDWHNTGHDAAATQTTVVVVSGRGVMLHWDGESWKATDALCPHKFANLADGTFANGCVTCPQHDATFNLETGHPGEGEDWAGRLPVHGVRVEDGRVWVCLR